MARDLSRSRVILIGNATYQHSGIPDLLAACGCVSAMRELLTGELCGWPADRVTTLVDLAAPHELASRVVHAVDDVEDVLLLYYVGHGLRTSEGQLALAVGQTNPDPELRAHTSILYENLAKILRGCRAATKLVILDCCHAELGNKANYVFQSSDLADAYPVDGLYFIGASAQDKKAKAPLDGPLTYFTDALITVINQGIPQRPAMLRLDQIFREVRAHLLRANRPEPVESGTRGAYQFPFARNAAPPEEQFDPELELAQLREQLAQAQATRQPSEHPTAEQRRTPQAHQPSADGADAAQLVPQASATTPDKPTKPKSALSRRRFLAATAGAGLAAAGTGAAVKWIAAPHDPSHPPAHPAVAKSPIPAPLGPALTGHEGVTSMAFSLDGHTLAASSAPKILLWNVADPAHPHDLTPLTVPTNVVFPVAFSATGRTLAAASGPARKIWLWDVTDPANPGNPISLTGPADTVTSMVFSASGHTLAASGLDRKIWLWDVTDPTNPGNPTFLTGPADNVTSVAFYYTLGTGDTLAAASDTGKIWLWDVTDTAHPGNPISLTVPADTVTSVAFSATGRALAASGDGKIWLWDMTDPAHPRNPTSLPADVGSVAFSATGHTLAANDNGKIWLWDMSDPAHPSSLTPLTGPADTLTTTAFSPTGHTLAADIGEIRLWTVP